MTTGNRITSVLTAIGLAVALSAPSYGQHEGVPAFDMDPTCRGGAAEENVDAADRKATFETCIQQERQAQDELKASWSTFPASDKRDCTSAAEMDGPPSYVDLLVCLQDRKFESNQQKASP